MKTIRFTQSEVEFLRELYTEEIANARNYIEQLKRLMKTMGIEEDKTVAETGTETVQVPKKRGRKPGQKAEVKTEPKKRGRKPKLKSEPPSEPKKRGRKPKPRPETLPEPKKRGRKPKSADVIPAYSLDRSAPKKKKKKVYGKRYAGGALNLPPMARQKNIKDLILEKFPEMIGKINKT